MISFFAKAVPRSLSRVAQSQRKALGSKKFSSSQTPTGKRVEDADVLLSGSTSKSLGSITRHGKGDACIILNVGGTEFITLRSTVAENPVLADHVARAEANQEFMQSSKGGVSSVFVDRDAKHFGFILQYLRNQVEVGNSQLPSSSTSLTTGSTSRDLGVSRLLSSWQTLSFMPQLPKDPKILAELYVEATYYRIAELQDALQDQSAWTRFVSLLGLSKVGGFKGNPFVRASQVLVQVRTALITLGTVLTAGTVTISNVNSEVVQKCLQWLGMETQEHTSSSENEAIEPKSSPSV